MNPFYEEEDPECPCPVCNQPIEDFVRLYISGDSSENDRLKRELVSVKRKLAHERSQLQQAKQELLFSQMDAARRMPKTSRGSTTLSTSHRMECVHPTVSRGGGDRHKSYFSEETLDHRVNRHSRQKFSRYRRHDPCTFSVDSDSDSDLEHPVGPESTGIFAGETKPDPPSSWILDDEKSCDANESDTDEEKLLSSWIDRMAIAVLQPPSLLSSFSSQVDTSPCGGE